LWGLFLCEKEARQKTVGRDNPAHGW